MSSGRLARAALRVLVLGVASLALAPGLARAQAALLDAIEYYNAQLDHYFVTALPDEITKLDQGQFVGWQRTGLSFKVYAPGTTLPSGASPVCRFYGLPAAGLDSHFYSASPLECAQVQQKFAGAWELESSNVFGVWLPNASTGACPSATVPVYRAWNGRTDSNHRYTTDASVMQQMIQRGYVAEGYGPPPLPVAMCAPTSAGEVPFCALTATDYAPFTGTTITLTATCSNAPTRFAWTNCTGNGSSCTASSMVAGSVTYSVVAGNAAGDAAPVNLTVNWQPAGPPPAPPTCAIHVTSQTVSPVAGSKVLLSASCTGGAFSWEWSACKEDSNVCTVSAGSPGGQLYTVRARNEGGLGPVASVAVDWQPAAPAPPGFCGNFPSVLYTQVNGSNALVFSVNYLGIPGFAWNGAWTVRFTLPPAPQSTFGRLSTAEYGGPPTFRDATVSTQPCDFRPVDGTGVNGPIGRSLGTTATIGFNVAAPQVGRINLLPGQTYWFNVRNYSPDTGPSCDPVLGRCEALVQLSLPQ